MSPPAAGSIEAASAKGETSYHLTLLAANRTGFENLVQLSSKAFLEGFYHKPRIDRELLEPLTRGLICLSGCVSGELSRTLLAGNTADEALARGEDLAAWFHRVFGDRYFIEIQNNGLDIPAASNGSCRSTWPSGWACRCVATSDAHYVRREDAVAQDVLLCINTGKFRTDTNRMRMEGDQFYLRSPEEMYAAFPGHGGCRRPFSSRSPTGSILQLELGKRHFPSFTPPAAKTTSEYLRELCEAGLRERYADRSTTLGKQRSAIGHARRGCAQTARPRAGRHREARLLRLLPDRVGLRALRRGAGHSLHGPRLRRRLAGVLRAATSATSARCEYGLLFERFLDENRREAPDIDIDFCKDRRGEVIQYVKDKYGEANVAQIGTFGTLAARAAIRDVGRTLGMPIFRVDQIVAMVPDQLGITLDDALEQSDDLHKAYDSDGEIRELIDLAMKIEGLARNVGTHAAAVVIAEQPVDEYVPLQLREGQDGSHHPVGDGRRRSAPAC